MTNDSFYKFRQANIWQKPKAEKPFDGLHTLSKQSQNRVGYTSFTLVALWKQNQLVLKKKPTLMNSPVNVIWFKFVVRLGFL